MSDKFLRQFDNAVALYQGSGPIARDYRVKVLGLRGYDSHIGAPGNDLGVYDDLIVACIGDESYPFRASTDPGWHYIQNPMNAAGCAVLSEATHFYKTGKHDNNKFDAFVQAERMKVYRLNREGQVQGSSWSSSTINIHSGAGGQQVGSLSAGCQIIYNPAGYFQGGASAPWFQFYKLVAEALAAYGQHVFPYKLMSAGEMV